MSHILHRFPNQKLINRVIESASWGLTRDDILNNIALYWLTGTDLSSGRLSSVSIFSVPFSSSFAECEAETRAARVAVVAMYRKCRRIYGLPVFSEVGL
ncbi:hypothetical protein AS026_30385 [Rhizobium altiplani]|uniref:Uncharacterized protein n=1 Tax=Rhizobium altiplani TaxID=1864509 RepID=A0A109K0E4_9HYPH|nr:hypothetical protein [Rhizobium altiplani]KWV58497.1 hypothetical protein AS026_30385 [Rhizobium altiplani]